jgi:serine phosphatase RsbU (regulator of sigma subunit)
MSRKTLILVVALLEFLILGGLVASRVAEWRHIGWTGFAYHPQRDFEGLPPDLPGFGEAGQVFVVTPGSPADRAGMTPDDRITAVEGVPITDIERLRDLSDRLAVGDTLHYTIERNGVESATTLTLENPLTSVFHWTALTTNLVTGLIFLLISLLVYWARPDSRVAGVFFAMCASGAAVYFFWAGGELDYPGLRGILPFGTQPEAFTLIGLTALASIVLTNLVLHLTLIFPRPRPLVNRWPQVFVWVHTVPFLSITTAAVAVAFLFLFRQPILLVVGELVLLVIAAAVIISLRRNVTRDGLKRTVATCPWRVLALIHLVPTQLWMAAKTLPENVFALGFGLLVLAAVVVSIGSLLVWAVLAAIALYRTHRESGLELRQQIRWPLWGTFTALVLSVVLSVVTVTYGLFATEIVDNVYYLQMAATLASKLVYLLIPVSFAVAILKYRLLDIDVIIKKTVVYAAVTGFVIAVYLVLAGVSGLALIQSFGLESQTATVVATLAVVALFVPVRNAVQKVVDRLFFQRARDLGDTVAGIAHEVLHGDDSSQILPKIAESVQRALRTGGLAIMARRPGNDRLVVETTLGLPDGALAGASIDRSDATLPGVAVLDAETLEGSLGEAARAARAHLVATASRDNRPVALLLVGKPQGRRAYDDDERRFLEQVTDQIAIAVGRSMQRQAEGELEKARAIQRSLLPQTLPEVDGLSVEARWEPAREVSGDYYDVIRLDDHRLMVCIGDVVGKGLPAALLMSTLQAAVKAVAATTDQPARLCQQVRAVVRGSLAGGTFVTFFCAVVDRASLEVVSCNAGHNPSILVHADGGVTRLERGGPAMARLLDIDYLEERHELAPGDRLVLFTDGATEAMSPDGSMFGDQQLENLAVELVGGTVAEVERGLAATVVAHARGILQDDLTLVVVGVD